jgi:NADPH-dependent 2,4-dienoyl-CoA reductase/sulfur reductase-like enzyme
MKPLGSVGSLAPSYDLIVVGAGPAGLSAASVAASLGVETLLVDENGSVGGQIYRGIGATPVKEQSVLGADYWHGTDLAAEFAGSDAAYLAGGTTWSVAPVSGPGGEWAGLEIGVSHGGTARLIAAKHVIGATGALERPFPIPGWTLPGVMTAGAAQIALKTAGLVPDGRVVVAGSGPLLYLLTAQLRAAGAQISTMLDTTPRANWLGAARHALDFLRSPYLGKGLKLLVAALKGMRVVRGVTAIRAEGEAELRQVSFMRGSKSEAIPCDLLLLHQGVVPNISMSNALGCAHEWDHAQLAWRPRVDAWFETTIRGFSVAGDGAGIAGAEAAALRGRVAALGAASRLGKLPEVARDRMAAPVREELGRLSRGRSFLDALYRPAQQFRVPPNDETIVCRCEEISAGSIRETLKLGVHGPNQLKAFLRCGMGPCQGRMCGLTVTELIAQERGVSPAEVGGYRLRPPFKPITVGEIASLPTTEAATKAVVR